MIPWKRLLMLGFLSWLIPFAIGFVAFPLKRVNQPLFDTVLALAVVATAGGLLQIYFRGRSVRFGEAILAGVVFLACNLILDYPMFAFGPMRMSAAQYYSEIGAGYLAYPIFAAFAGRLAA